MSGSLKLWVSAALLAAVVAGCNDELECTGGAERTGGSCKCPAGDVRLDGICVPRDGGTSSETSSVSDAGKPTGRADSAADSARERDTSVEDPSDGPTSSQDEDASPGLPAADAGAAADASAVADASAAPGNPVTADKDAGPTCKSSPEVCNGKDDDCDGTADNGAKNECGMACGATCPPASPLAKEIAAGDSHSCARLGSGTVSCWGANAFGQLGNGNRIGQQSPTAVRGITDAVELALGRGRSCARLASGGVSCWGAKAAPGTWVAVPTAVPGLTDAVALAAGSGQVCAIRAGGSAVCWGDGSELGTSGIAGSDTPKEFFAALAPELPPVSDISASSDSVCLVAQGVACFVRDGTVVNPLRAYSTVQIAGGVADHQCGRTRTNTGAGGSGVACWGENGYGQLGFAGTWDGVSAVDWVQGLPNAQIESIAVGGSSSCALLAGGAVHCWGNNSSGQLGGGAGASRSTPTLVAGLTSSVQVALGESHACALLADGNVNCWGSNASGQLGDGTTQDRAAPTVVRF